MLHNSEIERIRILLVDDHKLFVASLNSLIQAQAGMAVVGEAHNRREAIEAAARTQPDIILLDLEFETDSGLDFLSDLTKVAEKARILVLTGLPDPELHLQAVCGGALGVVFKSQPADLLFSAIRKVYAGEAWLNRTLVATAMTRLQARRLEKADPEQTKIASLTARELEIIAAVGEGRRNKGVAEQLFISEKTVRHYLTSIYDKLDVTDRLTLMIYAYQYGLAKVPVRQNAQAAAFQSR